LLLGFGERAHLSDMEVCQFYGEVLSERIRRGELEPERMLDARNQLLERLKKELSWRDTFFSKPRAAFKKRLMNEFYFIQFSDYKNIDKRKDTRLEDLLNSLRDVTTIRDIRNIIIEISHPTLHLEERFNELSRIPEAIGRLENFRNNIAHNRYVSGNDIENFKMAKTIINDVYCNLLTKLRDSEI